MQCIEVLCENCVTRVPFFIFFDRSCGRSGERDCEKTPVTTYRKSSGGKRNNPKKDKYWSKRAVFYFQFEHSKKKIGYCLKKAYVTLTVNEVQ